MSEDVYVKETVVVIFGKLPFKKRAMYNLQRYPIILYLINNVKDIINFLAHNLINFDNSHPVFLQGKIHFCGETW